LAASETRAAVPDRDRAAVDSKGLLDLYNSADDNKERLEAWLTCGPPRDCIAPASTASHPAGASSVGCSPNYKYRRQALIRSQTANAITIANSAITHANEMTYITP
jgi:hypothetical protein